MSNKRIILGKNLLVKTITPANTSSIMIMSNSNFIRGQIIEVGNGYSGDKEGYNMSPFAVGDVVTFSEKSATSIMLNQDRYLLVDVLNIIAIEKEGK